jgi:hypothetical protein
MQSLKGMYEKSQSKLEAQVENLNSLIKAKQDNLEFESVRKVKEMANTTIRNIVDEFNWKTLELQRERNAAQEQTDMYRRQLQLDSSMFSTPGTTPRNATTVGISDFLLTTPKHKHTRSMNLPADQLSKIEAELTSINCSTAAQSHKLIDFDSTAA